MFLNLWNCCHRNHSWAQDSLLAIQGKNKLLPLISRYYENDHKFWGSCEMIYLKTCLKWLIRKTNYRSISTEYFLLGSCAHLWISTVHSQISARETDGFSRNLISEFLTKADRPKVISISINIDITYVYRRFRGAWLWQQAILKRR